MDAFGDAEQCLLIHDGQDVCVLYDQLLGTGDQFVSPGGVGGGRLPVEDGVEFARGQAVGVDLVCRVEGP